MGYTGHPTYNRANSAPRRDSLHVDTTAGTVRPSLIVHVRATPRGWGDFFVWLALAPLQLAFYLALFAAGVVLVVLALEQLALMNDDVAGFVDLFSASTEQSAIASFWTLFAGLAAWLWSREWRTLTFELERIVVTRRFWRPLAIPLAAVTAIAELAGWRRVAALLLPHVPPRLAHATFSTHGLVEIRWGHRKACFVPREAAALQRVAAQIIARPAPGAPAPNAWAIARTLARRYVAFLLLAAGAWILIAAALEYANAVKGGGLDYVRSPLLTRLYLAKPRERTPEMLERYLLKAIETGSAETASLVIARGADVAQADREHWGLIRLVIERAHGAARHSGPRLLPGETARGIIELLLGHGARLDDYRGALALHEAAMNGDDALVRLLLKRGVGTESLSADGSTPLLDAVGRGKTTTVSLLIAAGASASAADDFYRTPLHLAAHAGHLDVARTLIAAGAQPDAVDYMKRTPLHAAAAAGHVELVRLLLSRGTAPDSVDALGRSPLHGSDAVTAKLLLDAGADPGRADRQGNTPLHLAAAAQRGGVIELLVDHQAPIDARNRDGVTPLAVLGSRAWRASGAVHQALEKDIEGTRAQLAEKERELAALRQGQETEAAEVAQGHVWGLRRNLKHKTEARDRVARERQQLMAAARRLLEAGADPNTRTAAGETPLHLAARAGNLDILPLLVERGAAVDARDNEGRTPLAAAAASPECSDGVVKFLLDKGAAPQAGASCPPRPKPKAMKK